MATANPPLAPRIFDESLEGLLLWAHSKRQIEPEALAIFRDSRKPLSKATERKMLKDLTARYREIEEGIVPDPEPGSYQSEGDLTKGCRYFPHQGWIEWDGRPDPDGNDGEGDGGTTVSEDAVREMFPGQLWAD